MTLNARQRRRLQRSRRKTTAAAPRLHFTPSGRGTLTAQTTEEKVECLLRKHYFVRNPDGSLTGNSPARALEMCLADPTIFKTPAGNMIEYGGRYLTPDEAEAFGVDAETIDREHPEGTLL